ncbi:MAG: acyltransferase family protein [Flavobacteriales bacterium]
MSERVFFPNLNSLRFIAAMIVIIGHIEQFKEHLGLPFRQGHSVVEAKLGVILFFVLSGFLITYLLLVERRQAGSISIRDFYLRRVYRIWPLYFLLVIVTLFVLPHIPFFNLPHLNSTAVFDNMGMVTLLCFLILPNVVLTSYGVVPYGNQAWSIGSEEQFYLLWPWLMKYVKNKWVIIFGVFILYHVVRFALNKMELHGFMQGFRGFWNTFNVDCMALGGAFALLYFEKRNTLMRLLSHPVVQVVVWITTIILCYTGLWFLKGRLWGLSDIFYYQIYAVLFGIIIFNLATNKASLVYLEFAPFSYLGKISYGLYMYHPIAIVCAIKLMLAMGGINNWVLYPLATLFTVCIAALSYHYLEKPFMRWKNKHTRVVSGG